MSDCEVRGARADRREAWFMGIVSAAMLVLPLVAWGTVRIVSEITDGVFATRRTGLDCGAEGACRAYWGAQVMYHRNDWDNDGALAYASPPRLLRDQLDADGQPLQLIDQAFAAATVPGGPPKMGYVFQEMQTIAGQPIDWKNDLALCAAPAVHGRTGYRTFIVRTDGTVFCKDLGSSAFVTDFPADPTADGWIVTE